MQLLFVKYQTLSVLMLRNCAPVFIFTTGSSTLLGRPRCGLSICCYLLHSIHFSEFMSVVFTRKWTKHKNTRSPPFSYDTKMAAMGAQSINSERASLTKLSVAYAFRRAFRSRSFIFKLVEMFLSVLDFVP